MHPRFLAASKPQEVAMHVGNRHTPDDVPHSALVPLLAFIFAAATMAWAAYVLMPQVGDVWSELPALTQTPATPVPSAPGAE
jgi:hypothetical protein